MKTRFFLCLFLLSLSCFSQNTALKTATVAIYNANYTMDFDAIAELTYPKIYEAQGKPAFVTKLDNDYLNDEFRMRIQMESSVFSYSDIKKIDGKTFCVVTYKNPARVFFEKKVAAAEATAKAATLKEHYRANEVLFEPKRNSFNVKRISKLVAILDETTKGQWRFINFDDPSQRTAFETLFGADVKKELGL
ncbi:MAG TPA: hypothetical protein PLS51_08565 [Flavobacterium sp.]|jgi:hypothetical protein|nr:hypothetical protein [Flavobacterium sp.]HPJ10668.1 hypothetical protein [Flavobacterium sp.]